MLNDPICMLPQPSASPHLGKTHHTANQTPADLHALHAIKFRTMNAAQQPIKVGNQWAISTHRAYVWPVSTLLTLCSYQNVLPEAAAAAAATASACAAAAASAAACCCAAGDCRYMVSWLPLQSISRHVTLWLWYLPAALLRLATGKANPFVGVHCVILQEASESADNASRLT